MTEYPMVIVRSLEAARKWISQRVRGYRRAGVLASSGARRLRRYGIEVQLKHKIEDWCLNEPEDVRSSSFLELPATEFDIQGLEVDWAIVCWDLDLRRSENGWAQYKFIGTRWQRVRNVRWKTYITNKYRVLLTRAREGIVIWDPPGCADDPTRPPAEYDAIAEVLNHAGARMLSN